MCVAQHWAHSQHLVNAKNQKKNKNRKDMLKNIKSNKIIVL